MIIEALAFADPPVTPVLSDLSTPAPFGPGNSAQSSVNLEANFSPGAVAGQIQVSAVNVSSQVSASWNTNTNSFCQVQSIEVSNATVQNVNGVSVGSGPVALSVATPGSVSIAGYAHFSVNGLGSLSVYGSAEPSIGVSGNWNNYSATVTGSLSITLTTDGLTLNGQTLPAGTYTITTNSATLIRQRQYHVAQLRRLSVNHRDQRHRNLGPGSGHDHGRQVARSIRPTARPRRLHRQHHRRRRRAATTPIQSL